MHSNSHFIQEEALGNSPNMPETDDVIYCETVFPYGCNFFFFLGDRLGIQEKVTT